MQEILINWKTHHESFKFIKNAIKGILQKNSHEKRKWKDSFTFLKHKLINLICMKISALDFLKINFNSSSYPF